jgi:hypothetical protein
MKQLLILLAFVLSLSMGSRAVAALIASESFDYPAATLGTASGGTGWSGAWAGGSTNVTSPGMTFGTVGSASNNALTINNDNNGAFRSLPVTYGTDGTTVWLSYLARGPVGGVATGYAGVSLFNTGSEVLFTGKRTGIGFWGVQRPSGSAGDSTVAWDTSTHLLVFQIEFGAGTNAGNERVTMYVDPAAGAAPNVAASVTLADVTNFSFNRVRLQGGNGSSFIADEVFLGTTFADVVPAAVPEPGMLGLAGLLSVGFFAWRRRK